MGDARVQALPLITVGDPQGGGHDWFLILSRLGLLQYDTLLARVVRAVGWLGMLATVCWFAWQGRSPARPDVAASASS